MTYAEKIVLGIPMQSIWNNLGPMPVTRKRNLNSTEALEIIKNRPITFVIADVGKKLNWINKADNYTFWKRELKSHIVENHEKIYLDDFTGNYAYIASEWTDTNTHETIILLEQYH